MKLLGIGDNTVDIYVDKGVEFPGGNTVNVAVFAKRLGCETSYLGCVGNDDRARFLLESLQAEKIDISHVRRLPEPNSWSRIRHSGVDRVFDGSHRISLDKYNLDMEDFSFIAAHDHCHSSVYSGLESELGRIADNAKCFSFDFSDEFSDKYVALVAPHIDIAFLSGSGRNLEECTRLADLCASFGCLTTVVTRGSQGAVAVHKGQVANTQPFKGNVVDTLGAGDGFIAGFIVGLHGGSSLPDALEIGAKTAADACAEQGAYGYATTT